MRSLAPLGGARVFLTEADPGTGPLVGNVSLGVGDDPEAVHARRRYLSARLGAPIVWMDQTHSSDVAVVGLGEMGPIMRAGGAYAPLDSHCEGEYGPVPADGVVIDARGWEGAPALAVMTADCLPVVLSADGGRVLGAVHAGRRGFLSGVLVAAVRAMSGLCAEAPAALIGPAICGQCYEVPGSMRDEAEAEAEGIGSRTRWGSAASSRPWGAGSRSIPVAPWRTPRYSPSGATAPAGARRWWSPPPECGDMPPGLRGLGPTWH
mgnify:CR=1 FL=1